MSKIDKIKSGYKSCCDCPNCSYFYICMPENDIQIGACEYIEQLEVENCRLRKAIEDFVLFVVGVTF